MIRPAPRSLDQPVRPAHCEPRSLSSPGRIVMPTKYHGQTIIRLLMTGHGNVKCYFEWFASSRECAASKGGTVLPPGTAPISQNINILLTEDMAE